MKAKREEAAARTKEAAMRKKAERKRNESLALV